MKVNITVKDINDNKPELVADDVFLCKGDVAGTVIMGGFDETRFVCVQMSVLTCVDLIRCRRRWMHHAIRLCLISTGSVGQI